MIREVFYKTPHNYDTEVESDRCGEFNDQPSLTVQSMAEDADLNVLMRRFGLTGVMPSSPYLPTYGDFTHVGDYQSALHAVMEADASFMALPADMRARFENSPQLFLEFCENTANADEMVKLGLRKAPDPVPAPMKVEVVNSAPAPAVAK